MITVKRVVSQVDYNYKILCAGKDFDIGKGMDVAFQYGSSIYNVTMHNSTAGRIGKLTKWYKENNIQEGMEISLCYDPNQNRIIASCGDGFSLQNAVNEQDEFDDDDWDFDDDIDDVDIKKVICNKCGTVLPTDAVYCYKCGERVLKDGADGRFNDSYLDYEKYNNNNLDPEEEQRREMLEDIFQDLDPLVWHGEHYIRKHRPTNMSVNNKWIIYRDNREGDALYIMNSQDSYYKIKIDTPVQEALLGINGKGIWTADYSYVVSDRFGGAWLKKIYCYDVLNHTRKVYSINKSKGRIYNSDICIYNDEIYYIVELSNDKSVIMRLNERGEEEELFAAHEDEQLYDLSVDETRIAFRYSPSNRQYGIENAYVVIIDKRTGEPTVIGLTDDPAEARRPLIPIHIVDIKNNMMATELTPYEMNKYQVNVSDDYMIWAVRPLAEPVELKLCTFAGDHKPAIYPILKKGTYFFDFRDCYAAPDEYRMNRIDISGRIFTIGPFGHGEADKIVISRDYVFCNCDAYNMGRYPRKFHSSSSYTEDNPEVDLIFGTNDFRFS